MGKLGFCRKWIDLIMRSVSTVSYSVLINGKPGSNFYPRRGIEVGDTLSPYLFILCAEGLSSVLNQSDRRGCTRGVTVARNGTRVNHLLFADDCILFVRAKAEEWVKIQELLLKYEKDSSQFLNKEKTAVFSNTNARLEEKKKIMELGEIWEKLGRPKGRGGLGFQYLESFNSALLAKQGWRFLQNPRSLVPKIFKEKYYRSCSLLEAKLGHRPSYIWRSVWGALELLQEGLRWRVGNGRSIRIWRHKWLPTPSSFCVQAPISALDARARVSELISNGEWDVELIKSIFRQEEVEQICSIPISKSNADDRLIWGCTKTRLFIVKSAYQLDMSRKEAVKGENSERIEGDKRWITDNSKCPICKVDEETVSHALWSCPAAADVWVESIKVTQKWKSDETNLLVFWEKMMERASREELEEIVMVMRSIWRDVRWSRPKELSVKANWDAAIDKKERKVGIGVVISDEEGEILVAAGEHMRYAIDAVIAESFALRKAMEVCRDFNFNNVLFEGDAQNIVNAVNAETKDMTRYGSVIEDVKCLLKGREKWSVRFIYREANKASHVLAREALQFQSKIVWIEDAPDCIRSIIVKEKSCSENIVQ
ncbi:uncharacterized protein LOC122315549 [Carya illinoinensis]|uniref:uncharacterized protein LOC122315549 n=1 Tax=Carya illinoinensis TaxID=32201 RepID=UPI001C727571|nr:uncharacterized protein LOC122315549 [Carya illinoinensis]